jgi:hypothetical protein
MQRGRVVVWAVVSVALIVGLISGALALAGGGPEADPVQVVFGESDGLPETIDAGNEYRAAFVIEWSGPLGMRDGVVSVFASRLGDTTEDAPDDGWPLLCESEFDDVDGRSRLACDFTAPGPGEFALQLEVRSGSTDEVIGEGLYTHFVIDPTATTVAD